MTLRVQASGPLTLVEDAGRPGWAHVGVTRSGAADRSAYALGNRLVGNRPGAASLEVMLGGLALVADHETTVAVTGAFSRPLLAGREVAYAAPVPLRPGDRLVLQRPDVGLRTYLAVRGGIDVPAVLGSRSTDTLSGLGPAPVRDGDRLPVGSPLGLAAPAVDVAPVARPSAGPLVLAVTLGPRHDWVDLEGLLARPWVVSARSDRVGIRLDGPPVGRPRRAELASEGVVRGGVQIPAGGEPVVFLADHPVTGGYPVALVLTEAACDEISQAVPGQEVTLRLA